MEVVLSIPTYHQAVLKRSHLRAPEILKCHLRQICMTSNDVCSGGQTTKTDISLWQKRISCAKRQCTHVHRSEHNAVPHRPLFASKLELLSTKECALTVRAILVKV